MTGPNVYSGLATARLTHYVALLSKWNRAINLVSPGSLADVWARHIADSAQLLNHTPAGARTWVDMGAGAGFPGVVIALISAEWATPLAVTLLESDQRKAAFLSTVSRETGVPISVHAERIELVSPQRADVISARALAPLSILCAYAERHLAPGGTALFLKGSNLDDEVTAARKMWSFDLAVHASRTDPAAHILELKDLRRA